MNNFDINTGSGLLFLNKGKRKHFLNNVTIYVDHLARKCYNSSSSSSGFQALNNTFIDINGIPPNIDFGVFFLINHVFRLLFKIFLFSPFPIVPS